MVCMFQDATPEFPRTTPHEPRSVTPYDDAAGEREASRHRVNAWIRTPGHFDTVIDVDRAVRDPARPSRLLSDLQVGDGLHLDPKGYGVLAGAVPERLFRR